VADLTQRDIPADWVEQRRAFGFLWKSGPIVGGFRPNASVFGELLARCCILLRKL